MKPYQEQQLLEIYKANGVTVCAMENGDEIYITTESRREIVGTLVDSNWKDPMVDYEGKLDKSYEKMRQWSSSYPDKLTKNLDEAIPYMATQKEINSIKLFYSLWLICLEKARVAGLSMVGILLSVDNELKTNHEMAVCYLAGRN